MTDVRMPDGTVVRFPDDMPREQIKGLIASKFPEVAGGTPEGQAAPDETPWYMRALQTADDAVRLAANGATFGFADQLAGLTEGGKEASRARTDAAYDRLGPVAGTGAYMAGAIAPVGALTKAGVTATRLVPAALRGGAGLAARTGAMAVDGAGLGALGALGHDENVATGALTGAALGAVGNVAGEALGAGARALGQKAGIIARSPTKDALKDTAQALYRQADQSGTVVRADRFANIIDDVIAEAKRRGVDEGVTPKAWAAVTRLMKEKSTGAPKTLQDLDTLRQVLLAAQKEGHASATAMLKRFDQRLDLLGRSDLISGTGDAVKTLKDARGLWQRFRKADQIEGAIEKAANAASGMENGLRNEFRKLLNSKTARWSDEERKALERVVRGTAGTNLLRFLGTFGYSTDQARSFLGAVIGGGVGAAAGGPLGAVAIPAVGTAAKSAGRAATMQNAELAAAIARAGQVPQVPPNFAQRALSDYGKRAAVIQGLLAGGAGAGALSN